MRGTYNAEIAGSSPAVRNKVLIKYRTPYVTMAEWSNATDSRSVSPGSAGSNPAGDKVSLVSSVGRASDF